MCCESRSHCFLHYLPIDWLHFLWLRYFLLIDRHYIDKLNVLEKYCVWNSTEKETLNKNEQICRSFPHIVKNSMHTPERSTVPKSNKTKQNETKRNSRRTGCPRCCQKLHLQKYFTSVFFCCFQLFWISANPCINYSSSS